MDRDREGKQASLLRCCFVGRAEQAIRQSTDREVPGIAPGLDKLSDSGSGQPIDADKGLTAESFVQPATESVTAGATGVSVGLLAMQGMASLLMQIWSTTCTKHICMKKVMTSDAKR